LSVAVRPLGYSFRRDPAARVVRSEVVSWQEKLSGYEAKKSLICEGMSFKKEVPLKL